MEYNSFYGGRRGASFVIVKAYPDIPSMATDFRQGGSFITVNYDEYVIINTVNKNHPDNGKIFRRGYDYNSGRVINAWRAFNRSTGQEIINGTAEEYAVARYEQDTDYDSGGAIYVGTIVGPAGKAPMITLTTYADAASRQAQTGYDERKSYGQYSVSIDPADLLPGKYEQNGSTYFNDVIEWYCTSIREINDEDTTAYVGFKFPYTVIDYETHQVNPYNTSHAYADMTSAVRVDDGSHPFYEKWNIAVPKGVKGDTINNFRVITPEANDVIYTVGTTTQYPGFSDDVTNSRKILVYDFYNYDSVDNPATTTYYIGDYNEISDFTIDEYGTVVIAFTHEDTITYHQLIKWITDITMNENLDGTAHEGRLIVKYNTFTNNERDYDQWDLNWVRNITFDQDGSVHIDRTVSGITDLNQLIYWIKSVSLVDTPGGLNEGRLNIKFNHGQDYTVNLKWVNSLSISEEGKITLHYSGGGADKVLPSPTVRWIDDIKLHSRLNDDPNQEEGSGSQQIEVIYNTKTDNVKDSEIIGDPLNYIVKMTSTKDHHLLVWYSDPVKRQDVFNNNRGYINGTDQTILNPEYWLDLGSVYFDSGIYVGLNIDPDTVQRDISDQTKRIAYLNELYSTGLTGQYLDEKLVTIGNNLSIKEFYAFDYSKDGSGNYLGWYYLGSLASVAAVVAKTSDDNKVKALSNNGIWLQTESIYTLTYNLANAELDKMPDTLKEGSTYAATVIPDEDLGDNPTLSVSIRMSGIDVTASYWNALTKSISIFPVIGNIVITITAS